jgi:twinkle protein
MQISERAIEWLDARGLDAELAVKLGLESSPKGAGGPEEICFPYYVGTEAVNHKYRRLDEKRFRQDRDAVKCFWNFNVILDQALANEPLLITEGEIDAMTAIQAGYIRSVSVPDGAPARSVEAEQSRKYTYIEHAKAALKDVKEFILVTDGDGPGQALMNDLSIRLGKARCKWVKYPKGCKDLNETLVRYGERGVHEVIRRAEWCKVDGVYKMSELPPYPIRDRYTTGMEWLDRHYRIRMGDFCVITGVPGHGKSTFVNDLMCRTVKAHKWKVAIASFEQHPQADHRRALREWFLECPVYDERGVQIVSDQDVVRADHWIDDHFVFIVPSDDDLANLEWVREKCASAVMRHSVRMIVIDPWNELDHSKPYDVSLTEYTGRAIKEFKLLARHMDVHVIVVAHPTKLSGGEIPGLYSISDSAHWANKPDVGLVIWKPDIDTEFAEVKVVKSRYHDQIGKPGMVPVRYNSVDRRFERVERVEDVAA